MDHATLVESAVKKFYASGDNETHSWLLQVQSSKEAWTFVWQLLDSSKSAEIQFFAANTLHSKISKQMNEVPQSEYLELRARILEVLKCPRTSLVLSRLCDALASFMVNYNISQSEEEEKCIVEEVMEILPYNSRETVVLLLKVLEAIPNEANQDVHYRNQTAKLGRMRKTMLPNWNKTVWLLQQIFSSCSQRDAECDSLFLLGIECCLSWLRLGQFPLDTAVELFPHLLVAASRFSPKREEDMECENTRGCESAKECLTMIMTHTELYTRPLLFWEWAEGLVCMVKENGPQHFYEVLTVFGEAHSRSILLTIANEDPSIDRLRYTAQQVIEFLLQCSEQQGRYPTDERRSCVPFGFWYAFQDDLATIDEPLDKKAAEALKPIYIRLAQALLRKCMLPSTPSEAGTDDDRELFRCYRQDVADTLSYSFSVIDKDLLKLIIQRLEQPHDDVSKWTEIESAIFGFKSLCDIPKDEKLFPYITQIMNQLLTQIPYPIYPREVLCSACWAIGDYADWLGEHPEYLERALQLVMLGLTDGPQTASAASMALKDIARECDKHLGPIAPSLLDTIGRMLPGVKPGGSESLRLMYVAGKLLMSLPTKEEQLRYLELTLGICLVRLQELLQLPIRESQVAVCDQLKMITTFFTTFDGSISDTVLEVVLPIFEGIINHPEWGVEENTIEATFTCLMKALPALDNPERDIKRLVDLLNTSYKRRPQPATLNVLKLIVGIFGRHQDSAMIEIVKNVLIEVNALTLSGIAACRQTGGNLSDLSDLLEAYMNMLANVCRRNARLLLLMPDQVPEMLRCGMACLLLPELPAQRAAGHFLSQAISQSPHLQTFIHPIGQELIFVVIQYIRDNAKDFGKDRYVEPLANVLLMMNTTCSANKMVQWLRFALADYPLDEKIKDSFIQSVLRQRVSKRRMTEHLRRFSTLYWEATMNYAAPARLQYSNFFE